LSEFAIQWISGIGARISPSHTRTGCFPISFNLFAESALSCVSRGLCHFSEDTALNLEDFGWNSYFQNNFTKHNNDKLIPARVLFHGRGIYRLASAQGELWAEIAGAMRYESLISNDLPVCGDWVLVDIPVRLDRTIIRFLLPRRTSFSRRQAGTAPGPQVVAANIDTVCLVSGLDSDFNLRRIERYLVLAWESGARPVIVLNKADICSDVASHYEKAMSLAPGVRVFAVSAIEGRGTEDILKFAGRGQTLALLGSSGVGKSSIVNRLLGRPAQKVREIDSATGRGMHTTAARHLFLLSSGGLLMDTPGMRELQVWSVDEGLDATFEDIKVLAGGCRFRDCSHQTEPGCRVRASVERGELDAGRLANYFKLCREARYIELKSTHNSNWVEKERWKQIAKAARKLIPKR
jgi:ribosome biogenesis GTPase / thiamine phosphate phosphatase